MNFAKFIDNRFQELKMDEAAVSIKDIEAFPIFIDANIKAHHQVLTTYRLVLKWIFMPLVFVSFFFMLIGLRRKPGSPLLDAMRANRAKEEAEKAASEKAAARKVGMNDTVKLVPAETL